MVMILLRMSASAGLLILAVALLRWIGRNYLPKRLFVGLWMVAVLRLLVPGTILVPWEMDLPFGSKVNLESTEQEIFQERGAGFWQEESGERIQSLCHQKIEYLAVVIWLLGVAVCTLMFWQRYRDEQILLGQALALPDETVEAFPCLSYRHQKKQLCISDQIPMPVVFGFWKQQIVLPAYLIKRCRKNGSQQMLETILLHEEIHLKRHDNLRKAVCLLAVCLHWFNPAVWILWHYFKKDVELSCDEEVLRYLGESKKKEYAQTLLVMAEYTVKKRLVMSSGFGTNGTKERMGAIMKYCRRKGFAAVSAAMILGASVSVFVAADETGAEKTIAEAEKVTQEKDNKSICSGILAEYSDFPQADVTENQSWYGDAKEKTLLIQILEQGKWGEEGEFVQELMRISREVFDSCEEIGQIQYSWNEKQENTKGPYGEKTTAKHAISVSRESMKR